MLLFWLTNFRLLRPSQSPHDTHDHFVPSECAPPAPSSHLVASPVVTRFAVAPVMRVTIKVNQRSSFRLAVGASVELIPRARVLEHGLRGVEALEEGGVLIGRLERAHLTQSRALRGHQRSSEVIRGHQRSSTDRSGSKALRGRSEGESEGKQRVLKGQSEGTQRVLKEDAPAATCGACRAARPAWAST